MTRELWRYTPKLLELASLGCRVKVIAIVWSCINFTVFLFLMVPNKNRFLPRLGVTVLLVSDNTNVHSTLMLSLQKYLGQYMCCCRSPVNKMPTIITGDNIQTLYRRIRIKLYQLVREYHLTIQVDILFLFVKNIFYTFNCLNIFKADVTGLTDESADVCLRFSVDVTSHAFERILSLT